MINFDDVTKENIKKFNPNWPQIPDHSNRLLITEGSGSWKTNLLFKLINRQLDIDKSYLFTKDPLEAIHQFLINKLGSTGLKHFDDSKAFIEFSHEMDDIYNKIEDYNPNKKSKILILWRYDC